MSAGALLVAVGAPVLIFGAPFLFLWQYGRLFSWLERRPIAWLGRRLFGGYPFSVWLRPSRIRHVGPHSDIFGDAASHSLLWNRSTLKQYRLYLYPEQLIVWHWVFCSVLTVLHLTINWQFALAFLAAYLMFFILRFIWLPPMVLAPIVTPGNLPPNLETWLVGQPERITLHRKDLDKLDYGKPADRRLGVLLSRPSRFFSILRKIRFLLEGCRSSPRRKSERDGRLRRRFVTPLWQRIDGDTPIDNPRKVLLETALASYFSDSESRRVPVNTGILRWILTWCAPLWIAFISICVPLAVALWADGVFATKLHSPLGALLGGELLDTGSRDNEHRLTYVAIAWMALSMTFLYFQLRSPVLHSLQRLPPQAFDSMPIALLEFLPSGSDLPRVISAPVLQALIALIYTAVFGAYLLALDFAL